MSRLSECVEGVLGAVKEKTTPFLLFRRPPKSTLILSLFPYPTLSR
eukprot:COSAG01_NODE_48731_length_378_cov_1.419355_1_plen_45_part_10